MEKTEQAASDGLQAAPKFSKEQLLNSRRHQRRRDLLEAVLDSGKTYSNAEVERIVDNFMKER